MATARTSPCAARRCRHPGSRTPDSPPAVHGWTPRQLRALAAIFATFVEPADPDEPVRHAALAATALSEVAEPSDLRLLKLLLDMFESRLGSVALAHGTRPFSKLSRRRRERILTAWSTSRVGRRRTFYQTVKRLATFFAYADPGHDGSNPRWTAMGYEPAAEQPRWSSDAVVGAMLRPDPDETAELALDAEVVVIGSGAGGGVIASRLAELGHEVLVVESGPFVSEADMPTDELTAFDRLYLDHAMASSADLGVAILAGAAVGGGTLVNWTTCIEPPAPARMEWATNFGLSGFDDAEGDADLALLRTELGFAPPPSIGPKDVALMDGAHALGWEAAPTERNAVDCGDCGSCGFGCRRGAKRSGQRVHLAQAVANGARILPDASVRLVVLDNGRAAGVSGVIGGHRPFRVSARTVILAAGALRTPVILERSGVEAPALGRNLYLHPTCVIAARLPARVDMWRDTMQGARSLQFVADHMVIESAPGHPGLIALAFPWSGAAQHSELMGEAGRYAPFIGIVSDLDGGRVSATKSGRARIEYRVSTRDAESCRRALVNMARIGRAAGAERLVALGTPAIAYDVAAADESGWNAFLERLAGFDFAPNRATVFSAHQMGTARAGSDPRTTATDPWGRVRRDARGALVGGLYVADASLFPTSVGVNPMITVMALAARVARAVHADGA